MKREHNVNKKLLWCQEISPGVFWTQVDFVDLVDMAQLGSYCGEAAWEVVAAPGEAASFFARV